jgi:hypothetical protein
MTYICKNCGAEVNYLTANRCYNCFYGFVEADGYWDSISNKEIITKVVKKVVTTVIDKEKETHTGDKCTKHLEEIQEKIEFELANYLRKK